MRQSELHHRQNDDSNKYRSKQSSLNGETEKRIVMLYTSGRSVDSIAREVGRARHRVVHILQTKGIFGINQAEGEDPTNEELALEEINSGSSTKEPGSETTVEKPPRKPPRRSKSTLVATQNRRQIS